MSRTLWIPAESLNAARLIAYAVEAGRLPMMPHYATEEAAEANAALIAAAPDMLAALREIEAICTETQSVFNKRMGTRVGNCLTTALAAIAKAEGRPCPPPSPPDPKP